MSDAAPSVDAVRSRARLYAGLPAAALVLVSFFIFLGFPYDRLASRLEGEISRALGVHVTIGELVPRVMLFGPGLEARGVRAELRSGQVVDVPRAVLRPAWSLSWLSGDPAVFTDVESSMGKARGTLTLGDGRGFSGDLVEVDLASLPFSTWLATSTLEGRGTIALDVAIGEEGPEGTLTFEAQDGSLAFADLPIAVPYTRLRGDVVLGGESFLEVRSMELEGPMLSANGKGRVARSPALATAPLDFELSLSAQPEIRPALEAAGLRSGRNGAMRLRVGGTPSRPVVR